MVFYLVSTFNANSIDKVDIGIYPEHITFVCGYKNAELSKGNSKNNAFIYNNCWRTQPLKWIHVFFAICQKYWKTQSRQNTITNTENRHIAHCTLRYAYVMPRLCPETNSPTAPSRSQCPMCPMYPMCPMCPMCPALPVHSESTNVDGVCSKCKLN